MKGYGRRGGGEAVLLLFLLFICWLLTWLTNNYIQFHAIQVTELSNKILIENSCCIFEYVIIEKLLLYIEEKPTVMVNLARYYSVLSLKNDSDKLSKLNMSHTLSEKNICNDDKTFFNVFCYNRVQIVFLKAKLSSCTKWFQTSLTAYLLY